MGLQHLEAALRLREQAQPGAPPAQWRWEPFQLNPDMPLSGMDRVAYEQRKFGAQRAQVRARMAQASALAGVRIDWDVIVRQPNTLALHALIEAAHDHGAPTAMARRLFEGFFVQGVDMGDEQAVADWVAPIGLAPAAVQAAWRPGGPEQAQVAQRDAAWRAQGVGGVPLFIFNQRELVSGAQPPEVLWQAMQRAA
jgi:predicted DsbA family dithiol-disulfide isomerase